MKTQDFDFDLPADLIAQHPARHRTSSRLLYLNSSQGHLCDQQFVDLKNHLSAGDVMVFNDTRVVKARLFGYKESGGKVEVMVERVLDDQHVLAVIRASHAPKLGGKLRLAGCIPVMVVDRDEAFYTLRFMHETPVHALLEDYGHLPLPPYIGRQASAVDESRYQTVYAKNAGAVAARSAPVHGPVLQQMAGDAGRDRQQEHQRQGSEQAAGEEAKWLARHDRWRDGRGRYGGTRLAAGDIVRILPADPANGRRAGSHCPPRSGHCTSRRRRCARAARGKD